MKATSLLLLGSAGALIAWWLIRKKNTIENLDISIKDINTGIMANGTKINPVVNLNLLVSNPTSESLLIQEIKGGLSVNNVFQAGTVLARFNENIPAFSQIIVPVSLEINSQELFNGIKEFINNITSPSAIFKFSGTVKYNNLNVPISLSYNLI